MVNDKEDVTVKLIVKLLKRFTGRLTGDLNSLKRHLC
jgi:hypothetical protein